MEVVIWGASDWGKEALELCKLMNFEVKAFVDKDTTKHGRDFEDSNILVYDIDDFNNVAAFENVPIIMATNDNRALLKAQQLSKNIIDFNQLKTIWYRLGRKDYPKISLHNENIENCKLLDNRITFLEKFPKGMIMAEVGSFKGDYAQQILEICKPTKLYLVDAWEGERWEQYYQVVMDRFEEQIATGLVEIRRGYSTDILTTFDDGELDWVYIDTIHDYKTTHRELELCLQKVKENGFICGHDYTYYNISSRLDYGVWAAVNEFMINHKYSLSYMTMEHHGCQSFCLEKMFDK